MVSPPAHPPGPWLHSAAAAPRTEHRYGGVQQRREHRDGALGSSGQNALGQRASKWILSVLEARPPIRQDYGEMTRRETHQDWIRPRGISNQGPGGSLVSHNPVLKESLNFLSGSARFCEGGDEGEGCPLKGWPCMGHPARQPSDSRRGPSKFLLREGLGGPPGPQFPLARGGPQALELAKVLAREGPEGQRGL